MGDHGPEVIVLLSSDDEESEHDEADRSTVSTEGYRESESDEDEDEEPVEVMVKRPKDAERSVPTYTTGATINDDDDDDEICVLTTEEADRLAPKRRAIAPGAGCGEDEVEVVAESANTVYLPHLRPHCTMNPFPSLNEHGAPSDIEAAAVFCEKCYCYVCDVLSSECAEWLLHCKATDQGPRKGEWSYRRKRARVKKQMADGGSADNDTSDDVPPGGWDDVVIVDDDGASGAANGLLDAFAARFGDRRPWSRSSRRRRWDVQETPFGGAGGGGRHHHAALPDNSWVRMLLDVAFPNPTFELAPASFLGGGGGLNFGHSHGQQQQQHQPPLPPQPQMSARHGQQPPVFSLPPLMFPPNTSFMDGLAMHHLVNTGPSSHHYSSFFQPSPAVRSVPPYAPRNSGHPTNHSTPTYPRALPPPPPPPSPPPPPTPPHPRPHTYAVLPPAIHIYPPPRRARDPRQPHPTTHASVEGFNPPLRRHDRRHSRSRSRSRSPPRQQHQRYRQHRPSSPHPPTPPLRRRSRSPRHFRRSPSPHPRYRRSSDSPPRVGRDREHARRPYANHDAHNGGRFWRPPTPYDASSSPWSSSTPSPTPSSPTRPRAAGSRRVRDMSLASPPRTTTGYGDHGWPQGWPQDDPPWPRARVGGRGGGGYGADNCTGNGDSGWYRRD